MPLPRKAFILAAGFGTRLRPLTTHTPKPLLPVWGRPILDHTLDLLASWGVDEVVINAHHGREAIRAYVAARRDGPIRRLHFSPEEEILGTGGALANASRFIDDTAFWMINGDILADVSPIPLVDRFEQTKATAILWMHPVRGPRTVRMDGERILDFNTPRPAASTFTFCGLQLLSPEILEFIPPRGFSTIIAAYRQALDRGRTVLGFPAADSFWADMGTPEAFIDAHRDSLAASREGRPGARFVPAAQTARTDRLQRAGVQIHGFLSAGKGCRIAPTARIRDSVLMENVTVAPHTSVKHCIAGPRAPLHGDVSGIAMAVTDASPAVKSAAQAQGWNPAETLLMPLPPRGSARVFSRLRHAGQQVIAIEYSLERPENARFVPNARFLAAAGIRVPRILVDDPTNRTTLVEDLGDVSLLALAQSSSAAELYALYERVIASVVQLHTGATAAARACELDLCDPFSPALYAWEHDLFFTHFVQAHLGLRPPDFAPVAAELETLAMSLLQCPDVLVHRDLQSSNILFAGDQPAFIDFQGMRYGAAVYDLASLLCDPYVSLPLSAQESLMACYAEQRGLDQDVFSELFWKAAVQRLVQALGAYGRLGALREVRNFASHIPAAVQMAIRASERVSDLPSLWHFFCCISKSKALT